MKEPLNDIFKLLDDDEDGRTATGIVILLFLAALFGGLLSGKSQEDKSFAAILRKIIRRYFANKIFSANNLSKTNQFDLSIDLDDFVQFFQRLPKKCKQNIVNHLSAELPEFSKRHCADFLKDNNAGGFKKSLKGWSYDYAEKRDKCLSNIVLLVKIYHVSCAQIKIRTRNFVPTMGIVADFIDVSKLIVCPKPELTNIVEQLRACTSEQLADNSKNITDNLAALTKDNQFSAVINGSIDGKKTKIFLLPMPPNFDRNCLKKLYKIMVEEQYFEQGQQEDFCNVFDVGIREDVHIKWTNKNQYEFQFFILALYDTSYHKLDKVVKANVLNIFYYKDSTPLKLHNTNDKDSDSKRVALSKKIKGIIGKCSKKV